MHAKNVCLDEFTPTQISLMLNGASTVDVDAIQKTSRYTGGFDASSSVVEIFWQVFRSFDDNERGLLQHLSPEHGQCR